MAYVTLADQKVWMSIGSTANDTVLSACIAAAQAFIEMSTGRVFEVSTDTAKTLDAIADVSKDGYTLRLHYDLASATNVTNGDGVVVASTQYVTFPATGPISELKLLHSSGKAWTYTTDPENAISIAGKWGYSTTAPAEIVHAAKIIAAQMYAQKENPSDADRIVSSDGVVIVPSTIPRIAADILRKYRRISF